MTEPLEFPFDPTGTLESNRIEDEFHALSPPAWKDYHFIIPKYAPFFKESLIITNPNTDYTLIEGVDYLLTHRFLSASRATAKPIYGSITFLNKEYSGSLKVSYQTLGGDWVINLDRLYQLLTQKQLNPRTTTWEQVVELPYQFPPIDHQWHLDDMVGMKEVKEALLTISEAISDRDELSISQIQTIIEDHFANTTNPHNVDKDQIGLDQVENFPIANEDQALDKTNKTTYMTPYLTHLITQTIVSVLSNHKANKNNPHEVTKDQINLGLVENYPIASLSQALEANSDQLYMTPIKTKALITDNQKEVIESPHIRRIEKITRSDYEALNPPEQDVLYLIRDSLDFAS